MPYQLCLSYILGKRESDSNNSLYTESQGRLDLILNSLNKDETVDNQAEEDFAKVIEQFDDNDWLVYRNVTWQWRSDGSVTNHMKEERLTSF